jgi:hypothetical protein
MIQTSEFQCDFNPVIKYNCYTKIKEDLFDSQSKKSHFAYFHNFCLVFSIVILEMFKFFWGEIQIVFASLNFKNIKDDYKELTMEVHNPNIYVSSSTFNSTKSILIPQSN